MQILRALIAPLESTLHLVSRSASSLRSDSFAVAVCFAPCTYDMRDSMWIAEFLQHIFRHPRSDATVPLVVLRY